MNGMDVDLRSLLRELGGIPPGGAISSVDLTDHDGSVELVEHKATKVSAPPAPIAGWIDGVQASRAITWVNQRPVQLAWTAAGAATSEGRPVANDATLWIGCSTEDENYCTTIAHGAEIQAERVSDPLELAKALNAQVSAERERLERLIVTKLADSDQGLVVADGPVVARTRRPQVVGVVKSHAVRYLEQEGMKELYRLPAGWRSAAFKISGRGGERFSSYLRLHDPSSRWWDFGLIRLEVFNLEHLDGLAAAVLAERQYQGSKDGRWDRHLGTIRWVEEWLRGLRPNIFG